MRYPDEVEKNAREMGFKAANKQFLASQAAVFNAALKKCGISVQVAVPAQYVFIDSLIKQHLNLHAPMWLKAWEKFREALAAQTNKRSLEQPALQALAECSQIIKEVFEEHPLNDEGLGNFLNKHAQYMVRSTGREDAIDKANPGGNESIPCVNPNAEAISDAAMQVCVSGLQLKSITQRLKSTKPGSELEEFTSEPFFPVLLDEMIGGEPNAKVASGVIYSGSGCTRIQAAPGFGELIVNSLGNFDSFYITEDGRSYAEIMRKDFRLSPIHDETSGKNKLIQVKNTGQLKNDPALPDEVVIALHELSKEIENTYGMKMDMEFAYDADKNVIYLLQARAIPLGERLNMIPASIAPDKIAEIKQDKSTRRGNIITPDVMRAQVVTSPDEIIIVPTIGEALDIYLTAKEETSRVKAVIVQQTAPDTSHEAGEFSSRAIPVLQVDNIRDMQQQVDSLAAGQAMIIDPQRKLSTVITVGVSGDIEKECYNSHLLAEGIFRSAISSRVTTQAINFHPSVSQRLFFTESRHESLMTPGALSSKIAAASKGDQTALSELMSTIFINLIEPGKAAARKLNIAGLRERLDVIPDINFGKPNTTQKKALAEIVSFIYLLQRGLAKKNKPIEHSVYQQLMLTALELLILINRAEKTKEDPDKQIEYLNLCEKFTGLITAIGEPNVFTDSLMIELHQEIIKKKVLIQTPEASHLTSERQNYFIDLSRVGHRIMNEANRDIWLDFCRSIFGIHSRFELDPIPFATLIGRLTNMGVLDVWLNTTFLDKAQECKGDYRKLYLTCIQDYAKSIENNDEIMMVAKLIEKHERQIGKWKDPAYFEKAFAEYQKMIELARKTLVIDQKDPVVKQMMISNLSYRLIDLMDKTNKSLERSNSYQDHDLHVTRFIQMLGEFSSYMQGIIKQTGLEYPCSNAIERELFLKNLKIQYLKIIDNFRKQEVKDYQGLINSIKPLVEQYLAGKFEKKLMIILLSRLMSDVFASIGNEVSLESLSAIRAINELIKDLEVENFIDTGHGITEESKERIRNSGVDSLEKYNKKYRTFYYAFEATADISELSLLWSTYQREYLNVEHYLFADYLNGKPFAVEDHWWSRPVEKEFTTSGNFSYLGYIINTEGNIPVWRNISLEDLSTLLHQNTLTSQSLSSSGCSIKPERYPVDFVDKVRLLSKIANMGVQMFSPHLKLLSNEFNYPFITQLFNLGLRSHSASVIVKYNQETKEMIAEVCAFGGGGNENARWNNIEMRSNFFLRHYGIPILKSPYYDEGKNIVSYMVSIPDESSAGNLAICLADLAKVSFQTKADDGLFFLGKEAMSADLSVLLEVQSALTTLTERHKTYAKQYISTRLQPLDIQIALKEITASVESGNVVAAGAVISKYLEMPDLLANRASFTTQLIKFMTSHVQDEPWKLLFQELSRMDLNNNERLITFLQRQRPMPDFDQSSHLPK